MDPATNPTSVVNPPSDQESHPEVPGQHISAPSHAVYVSTLFDKNVPLTRTYSQGNVAPPIPTDRMDVLVALVEGSILEPEVLIKRGDAPVPKFIGIGPPEERNDEHQAFSALMGMLTMIRLFAAINQVSARQRSNRIKGYSIDNPKEIGLAFAEGADATLHALTEGLLSTFYSFESGQTQTANQSLKRAEIHSFVLTRIFGGIPQVDEETLENLDGVLTAFVNQVKPYKVAKSLDQPTMNHCVLINYVKTTDLTGSGEALVLEPYTRMVFLKVKADEWGHALQKPGFLKRNEKVNFSMEFVITEMKLDEGKYRAAKPQWEKVVQLIANEKEELKEIVDKDGIEGFGRKTSVLFHAQG